MDAIHDLRTRLAMCDAGYGFKQLDFEQACAILRAHDAVLTQLQQLLTQLRQLLDVLQDHADPRIRGQAGRP